MSVKYVLDDQIGYVLRRVTQRHLALFSECIPQVTTVQFAVLARLTEMGPQSQNHLGRATAMDAATSVASSLDVFIELSYLGGIKRAAFEPGAQRAACGASM